ncbi:hypothetical protein IWQ62_004069 [Dispira parvispora]|uniref:Uncharacterized protein n=1 Tax=Dispira parvispora TaxID=1520584 RepID=A0A9W8ATL4_9FUNG|nr:hypothetical protein IWQ62_004069 [Dispira parvispora]
MLVDQDLPEENKKGIDLLIEQGDATYKYFARFQFDQEIKDLDKVDNTEATKGYTACYDVTMRDGLDAVIKWSIATVYSGYLQPILEALKPQSRFYNFMLGSLHDSILVNNTDIMNILTNWVDCTKVEKSYQYYCSEIQNAIKGNKTSGIQLKPTLIDPDYVSYHGNQDTDSKIDNIRNFNRQTIDLVRLLDH